MEKREFNKDSVNLEGEYSWVGGGGGVDKVWKKYEVPGYSKIGRGKKAQGIRSTNPSCELDSFCTRMNKIMYPCPIGDAHVTKTRRSLVFIQDASKRTHGVLKSTKSSPEVAAPWQNL